MQLLAVTASSACFQTQLWLHSTGIKLAGFVWHLVTWTCLEQQQCQSEYMFGVHVLKTRKLVSLMHMQLLAVTASSACFQTQFGFHCMVPENLQVLCGIWWPGHIFGSSVSSSVSLCWFVVVWCTHVKDKKTGELDVHNEVMLNVLRCHLTY